MNAIAKQDQHVPANDVKTGAPKSMDMILQVIQAGHPIEFVREIMALTREVKQEQARESFDAAIANAKAEIKPVSRNRTGNNSKRYADFAAYAREIDPVISKFGLSYRFRTTQTDKISVTCVVSHRDGHSEENSLSGPADVSGNKNAIQAIGSTLQYLQRYTLCQAFGLASEDDDDGAASQSNTGPISDEQEAVIRNMIDANGPRIDKFCSKWNIEAVRNLPASKFNEAVASLAKFASEKAARDAEGQNNG